MRDGAQTTQQIVGDKTDQQQQNYTVLRNRDFKARLMVEGLSLPDPQSEKGKDSGQLCETQLRVDKCDKKQFPKNGNVSPFDTEKLSLRFERIIERVALRKTLLILDFGLRP
ncbi:hypothetical protein niasHS_004856 [Heterodera schachtii]|uniref:Uncharacterized protein n=1 Tax=Heterodera schachtii TaxID=97005 RepID=A0ABD2JLF9_HETSC